MLDTAKLAQIVTSLLSPGIPYLLKGGEQAWEEASKKIGTDTWEWLKIIWTKLTSGSPSQPNQQEIITEIIETATEVANNPSDRDAQVVLRWQIKKLLKANPELSLEIEKVVEQAQKSSTQTTIRYGGIDISGEAKVNNLGNIVGGNQTINNK